MSALRTALRSAVRMTLARARGARRELSQESQGSQSARLPVEALEGRVLLAGNVVTTPTGTPTSPGELTLFLDIQGDELGNEISVKKGTAPDEIIVNGLNGTLVNFSTQEWHFQGVRQLNVAMNGGDDVVKLTNLKLSSTPGPVGDPFEGVALFDVGIDGGAGDDQINISNTTFNAKAPADPTIQPTVAMRIFGDITDATTGATTGNDWIDLNNTTLIADGGTASSGSLQIFGDFNAGGTITGGNDHINVSNTVIRATNAFFGGTANALVEIRGDFNLAGFLDTSVIGEGNDSIDVNNTSVIADSAQGAGAVMVKVYGDENTAIDGGSATVGNFAAKTGGNDTISIANTTVSASGANFSTNSVVIDVRGDQNSTTAGVADVGGGNDNISITNFAASASGLFSTNETDLRIFGDGDTFGLPGVTSRVGVGNDVISLTNDDVFAAGNPNNRASLLIYSDDRTDAGEAGSTVGVGDDDVTISNFLLQASTSSDVQLQTQKGADVVDVHNVRFGGFGMSTGSGADDVSVLNSEWTNGNWDLEDGNDLLKMNGNTFVLTNVDGGAGVDVLRANNNTGVIVAVNFEQVNGMPTFGLPVTIP